MKTLFAFLFCQGLAISGLVGAAPEPGRAPHSANPILPGYYADPSIVQDQGKNYIYATLDPWGGNTLGCWESTDFKNWTFQTLNWPTKEACTSPTSKDAMVWAPSVVKGKDGRFYMYVSVGNEIWAGTADSPLGPWKNLLGDKPLIPENFRPGFHMIDSEAFIDEDGQAYLYWGSGWNWTNGHCFVVKLKPDMFTFDCEPKDVTPTNYFEAPFMVKHGGRYHLMYSSGKTTEYTYQVHCAVGDTPFGPFKEIPGSPVLSTDRETNVLAPGHHAVFEKDGKHYILYHRHSLPFDPKFIGRQTCVDELQFDSEGLMKKVVATHDGPEFVRNRLSGKMNLAENAVATASSKQADSTDASFVLDDNYATRWAAAKDAKGGWLQLDLGSSKAISGMELRPEYAWKPYRFTIQTSDDGKDWKTLVNDSDTPVTGSPILIEGKATARYLRMLFPESEKGSDLSLFEWLVY